MIEGLRTWLGVSGDATCWKPPSEDNHRKESYPRKQQCDQGRIVNEPTSSGPNSARTRKYKPEPGLTRKLICSPNHARKKTKVKLGPKNLAMLPSYFPYIFVHLRQKSPSQARNFCQL